MAGEIWLALAAACVACATWRGHHYLRHLRQARVYPARRTGEQRAVEHVGVTETSPRIADLPLAPPPPPVDPKILLAEAEGELVRAQRRVDELRAAVQRQEDDRLHIALDALQGHLVDRLRRAGHDHINTTELSGADIRRIVRSGAPR